MNLPLAILITLLLSSHFNTWATTAVDTASLCETYQGFLQQGVPKNPLKQAMVYFEQNRDKISNQSVITIADYGLHSGQRRFYVLSLPTQKMEKYRVSHGSGSVRGVRWGDRDHNGYLDRCALPKDVVKKSKKHPRFALTRPGFFLTGETYNSRAHDPLNPRAKQPWPVLSTKPRFNALRLDGLIQGVNDKARSRGVVMHEAFYNQNELKMGRSFGCPAFKPQIGRKIINQIKGGSLYYSYVPTQHETCIADMKQVLSTIEGWEGYCEVKNAK